MNNEKPETLTQLITGTPFLHAYYKRFSQLFLDDSTNLISLYIKNPNSLTKHSTPDFVHVLLSDCLKLFLTTFMNTPILVSKSHIIHFQNITTFLSLKNGFPFSYMTVSNVNVTNTSK